MNGDDGYKWVGLSNTTLAMLLATIDASMILIAMPDVFRGIRLNPLDPGNSFYLLWMSLGFPRRFERTRRQPREPGRHVRASLDVHPRLHRLHGRVADPGDRSAMVQDRMVRRQSTIRVVRQGRPLAPVAQPRDWRPVPANFWNMTRRPRGAGRVAGARGHSLPQTMTASCASWRIAATSGEKTRAERTRKVEATVAGLAPTSWQSTRSHPFSDVRHVHIGFGHAAVGVQSGLVTERALHRDAE